MQPHTFTTTLQQDPDGTWWYVHVPKEVRESYKQFEKRGIIHVTVTIGNTTWDGSMLPWADGSAQVTVNKNVRSKEGLGLSDTISMTLKPR